MLIQDAHGMVTIVLFAHTPMQSGIYVRAANSQL